MIYVCDVYICNNEMLLDKNLACKVYRRSGYRPITGRVCLCELRWRWSRVVIRV